MFADMEHNSVTVTCDTLSLGFLGPLQRGGTEWPAWSKSKLTSVTTPKLKHPLEHLKYDPYVLEYVHTSCPISSESTPLTILTKVAILPTYGNMQERDILILGAGWTASFLIPLLQEQKLLFAATTTDGRPVAGSPTIKWSFDPSAPVPDQKAAFAVLPRARHILITFPLKGKGQSDLLARTYTVTHHHHHGEDGGGRFIQLGSTGIWQSDPAQKPWLDRRSPYNTTTGDGGRAVAEDELLALGGCVLNLAGLWGGSRDARHWVDRVATTKEAVKSKMSLHMIHGVDVARVIVALIKKSDSGQWDAVGRGQRWMVTDGFVYDWWSLFAGWAEGQKEEAEEGAKMDSEPIKQAKWVYELMQEEDVRALPRSMEVLGRCYDTRELWQTLGITPLKGGLGL